MDRFDKDNEKSILASLKNLSGSNLYPLHMPGHKRNSEFGDMAGYVDIDITEIDNYDNLHDAEGIIKEAEDRANSLYGADETHFLINGSSCGVLSAVSAAVPEGGEIIAARNVHKSFYHAAYLRGLKIAFLMPESIVCTKEGTVKGNTRSSIMGCVTAEEVEKSLRENPDAKAVFITSPTYEGVVSDIKAIADAVHRHDAVLIVDEAHGAHFGLYEKLPESAVRCGADIVIHSVHKTLAAMTQTALIHVTGDRIDRQRLRRFLRIYQSSSPSYVLMASIDSCIRDINDRGKEIFERLIKYRRKLEEETKELKNLFVLPCETMQDPGKVLVCSSDGAVTGQQIYDILRLEYKLQCEMAGDTYALAIITGYDTEEGIDRLISAVKDIDRRISAEETKENKSADFKVSTDFSDEEKENAIRIPQAVLPFYKAWDGKTEEVDITRASGRVAGDFINLYPPGIPLVIPGELIDKKLVEELGKYINEGRNVQGVTITARGERLICCLAGE